MCIRDRLGAPVREALAKSKQVLRQTMYHSNFFEDLGYKYLGPADGHDLQSLFEVLERAREYAGPCVVHVHTIKGCGYRPARENPSRFHGVGAVSYTHLDVYKRQGWRQRRRSWNSRQNSRAGSVSYTHLSTPAAE